MNGVQKSYQLAVEQFAELGVDVEYALARLASISISLHCWQGDDVGGFEAKRVALADGLAVTGNYPGKARTADELRSDADLAFSLIPGKHRFNLHASYADTSDGVARDRLEPGHFASWIDWAKEQGYGLDFNPTFFAHPLASVGGTLSHRDSSIRQFWIDHGIACRKIGAAMGRALGSACVTNLWIPDGSKESPVDRAGPRLRLLDSLDAIYAEEIDPQINQDAVEGKLFGIGAESYTVGSHEFYYGYAITRKKLICLDAGHFHPTESVADKISSLLPYVDGALLHVSRGVRWDSDHVVTLGDDLLAIAHELVRGSYLDRVRIGLDYFDASVNRIAAWVIGSRAVRKALLIALLEPIKPLREAEAADDLTVRLALIEEYKALPFGAVWDGCCERAGVPVGTNWLDEVRRHERDITCKRT